MTVSLSCQVSIRCQDVAVHFTSKEWEYIEGHKDLYKNVMMEDQQPLTALDGSNEKFPAERCPSPLCSRICPEDICNVRPQQPDTEVSSYSKDEDLINIKVEIRKQEEETSLNNDHICKEEENPTYIDKDGHYSSIDTWETCLELPQYCKSEHDIITDSLDVPITAVLHQVRHCPDLTSDTTTYKKPTNTKDGEKPSAVRRTDKTYQCTECCKTFSQNADLIRHFRVHTGERPFLCTECGKRFTQKSALVYHKRVHTGEKPFLCFDCGKCFAHKSILINHRRVHTGEKPFPCANCGKCFAYKSYLIDHQRIHSGVKPHHCMECRKCFTHKSDLNRHRRVHSGEKPFTCSECGKRFTQRAYLAIHQKTHLEKPRP
ncbi:zinc finger protein 569-like [Leptodactylus fuscus]